MIEDLKRWAVERGAEQLVIPVVPTARNRPALDFLSRLCEFPADFKIVRMRALGWRGRSGMASRCWNCASHGQRLGSKGASNSVIQRR